MEIADQIQGGILFNGEESGDCRVFTQRLAETIQQRGGSLRTDTTIERIEVEGDRVSGIVSQDGKLTADAYVLALGWSSPALGRPLGLRLPIAPVKGYSITLPIDGWNASPKIPVLDDALKIAVTPLGTRLRLAGSAEFTGPDLKLNRQRSDYVWQTALELYPALARHADPEQVERWTGLRPMTPDGPPILGGDAIPQPVPEHRPWPFGMDLCLRFGLRWWRNWWPGGVPPSPLTDLPQTGSRKGCPPLVLLTV